MARSTEDKLLLLHPVYRVNENILLKQPDTDLAKEFFKLVDNNRSHLDEFLPWVKGTKSPEDTAKFMFEAARYNEGGQQFNLFIYYKDQPAGSIGFVHLDRRKFMRGEIGYWLRQDLEGKGIITMCAKFLMDFAFEKLQLQRIEIKVLTNNIKSAGIPKRLGFVHEGTLRKGYPLHGAFRDIELYSKIRED